MILTVRDTEVTPELVFPGDIDILLAGEGEYSCCQHNHDFGQGPIACDKARATPAARANPRRLARPS